MHIHKKIFLALSFFCSYLCASEKQPVTVRGFIPLAHNLSTLNEQLVQNVTNDKIDGVRQTLQQGAEVNTQFHYQQTPLHYAVTRPTMSKHKKAIIKMLLLYKADPNIRNRRGTTPFLAYICHNPHPEIVRFLLQAQADPSIADQDGDSPLTIVTRDHTGKRQFNAFLQHGFIPEQIPLKEAKALLEPRLQPFISVTALSDMVISYLVKPQEKKDDSAKTHN